MPILTLCRSCDTVDRAIRDRCKYCGSQRVEVKSVAPEMIDKSGNREFLINRKKENGRTKAHS